MRLVPPSVVLLGIVVAVLVLTPVTAVHIQGGGESMEPTLRPGDLVFVYSSGDYDSGDIILFETRDGRATLHRIVGQTDGGYVTKGDANPTTDQQAGAPPVPADRIHGEVLTVASRPLVLRGWGGVLGALAARIELLAALGAILAGALLVRDLFSSDRPSRDAGPPSARSIALVVLGAAFVASVGLIVLAPTTATATPVVTQAADSGPLLPKGETEVRTVATPIRRDGTLVYAADAVGGHVVGQRVHDGRYLVDVRVGPYAKTGPKPVVVRQYAYPHTLPTPIVSRLHALHPVAAAGATASVPALLVALLVVVAFDGRVPSRLFHDRGRNRGLLGRIR